VRVLRFQVVKACLAANSSQFREGGLWTFLYRSDYSCRRKDHCSTALGRQGYGSRGWMAGSGCRAHGGTTANTRNQRQK
jgi:hypothetical protein